MPAGLAGWGVSWAESPPPAPGVSGWAAVSGGVSADALETGVSGGVLGCWGVGGRGAGSNLIRRSASIPPRPSGLPLKSVHSYNSIDTALKATS